MNTKLNTNDHIIQTKGSVSNFERVLNIYPHPIALVFLMTFFVIVIALFSTGKTVQELLDFWGKGFVNNFSFGMQFMLLLFLSYALAITPIFKKFLGILAGIPKRQFSAVFVLVSTSIVLSLFNWCLGIIGGVLLAKMIAKKGLQEGKEYDYPLLISSGIAGILMWEILSGLGEQFAILLAGISTSGSFPVVALLSSSIVNFFIPHTGVQWLVEGGSLINVAADLGVSNIKTLLAFSYGAGWTKLLLIALFAPVIEIQDIKMAEIGKYLGVMMVVSMIIYILALIVIPV